MPCAHVDARPGVLPDPIPQSRLGLLAGGDRFVPLFLCLGSAVLYEHLNYLRALLPMTIAFQVELMRATVPSRWAWFAVGNLGLGLELHGLLVKTILPAS